MIHFACPGCGSTFNLPDEKAGKTGKCPKCEARFVIPEAPPSSVVSRPPPSSMAPPPAPPPAWSPPSVPAPPPPSAAGPVEINPCPGCQARLSVAASDLGLAVECPYCKTSYEAVRAGATAPVSAGGGTRRSRPVPPPPDADAGGPRSTAGPPSSRKTRRDEYDDDEFDEPESDTRRSKSKRSKSSGRGGASPGFMFAAGVLELLGGMGLIVYGLYAILGMLYLMVGISQERPVSRMSLPSEGVQAIVLAMLSILLSLLIGSAMLFAAVETLALKDRGRQVGLLSVAALVVVYFLGLFIGLGYLLYYKAPFAFIKILFLYPVAPSMLMLTFYSGSIVLALLHPDSRSVTR